MLIALLSFVRSLILFSVFFTASLLPQPTYIEGVAGQPTGFTPTLASNDIDRSINKIIYRSLFTYDNNGDIALDLADHWEVSEDGLAYTVRLKSDERWQDGKAITSNDILYTVGSYKKLAGIVTDKLDNRTVRFTLPNKFTPFLDLLTVALLPEHKGEFNDRWMPVGSGAYRVVRVNRDRGRVKNVVLEGNSPALGVTRLILKFYDNDQDLETAAKLGEVNAFYEKSSDFVYKNFVKYSRPEENRYYALFFNTRQSSLKNIDVRSFLANHVDTAVILKFALGDDFVVDTGPLSLNKYARGDISYAVSKSIKDVSLPKSLNLVIVDNEVNQRIAEGVKTAWEKFGVAINILALPAERIANDTIPNRNFDVLLYGQEVSSDPDRYVLWHTTQIDYPGLNLSGISNARVDKALEEGRKVSTFDDRYTHYSIFQKAIMDEVPAVFLYHPVFNYYVRSNLVNVDLKNFTLPEDRFDSVSKWAFD